LIVQPPLMRALALLQRYPLPLLLPTAVIVAAGVGINRAFSHVPSWRVAFVLAFGIVLLIHFFLTCVAFLCVANYTAKSESNRELPKLRNMLDSFGYPGCARFLRGLLSRFALTLVIAGALTMVLVSSVFAIYKASAHHPVSRPVSVQVHLWTAIVLTILILSRWALAIPLFVQSEGLLKTPIAASVNAIRGHRGLVVLFTLLIQVACYPLIRLTSPLHPHLSDGAARYVPQLLEIIAAHGFVAVLWTWWMIVITMLAMRLQGHDEPLPATPMASA
jgi:hypothetical protein